jgi:hypothetical protein
VGASKCGAQSIFFVKVSAGSLKPMAAISETVFTVSESGTTQKKTMTNHSMQRNHNTQCKRTQTKNQYTHRAFRRTEENTKEEMKGCGRNVRWQAGMSEKQKKNLLCRSSSHT